MDVTSPGPVALDAAIRAAVLKRVHDQLKSQGESLLALVRSAEGVTAEAGDLLPHLGRHVDVRV